MIINIPLQIDEKKMEEVVERDYEGKVFQEVTARITDAIKNRSTNYYGDRVINGLQNMIYDRIDEFLQQHKDVVIDKAAKELAERLARSKRGKELLEKMGADNG